MNNKNKNAGETAPSLDLSFAYGTTVIKHLTERDIASMAEKEAEAQAEESTGDTTIRAVTSLFVGKRHIVGLGLEPEDDDEP